MYWDKIVFPKNNLVGFAESPDIEFLKSTGDLKQTQVQIPFSGEFTQLYLEGQLMALQKNNEVVRGCWTLGQENVELVLPSNDSVKTRSVEVDLYKSLPILTTDISFEDILYFKEKRKDELMEFRGLMDEFYFELINS